MQIIDGRMIKKTTTTTFQKLTLGMTGGLVALSVVAALVYPPNAATHAPRAVLDLFGDVLVSAVPVGTVEAVSLPILKPVPSGPSVAEVRQALAYDLETVKAGAAVPRVFLASIPRDISDVRETAERKAMFFKSVLPLVLQVNEEILADRTRLQRLQKSISLGHKPAAVDRLWLAMMSERYGTARDDIGSMLGKVDIVPPSLALAQAATESGWGTSRFVREGNSLFGQWTYAEGNLVPEGRDNDKQHMIKSFETLIDSVRGYATNLNSHRAYREFRAMRADLRKNSKPIDGRILAGALHRYSELGVEYVNAIRSMIGYNKLNRFDRARLSGDA